MTANPISEAVERLRLALKMHDENRTTLQSLASSVGDFLRDYAAAQQQASAPVGVEGQLSRLADRMREAIDVDGTHYRHIDGMTVASWSYQIKHALVRQPSGAPVGVEAKARAMFEAEADYLAAPWTQQWEPTKDHWRAKARESLAPQPAAPVGVEDWLIGDLMEAEEGGHTAHTPAELCGLAAKALKSLTAQQPAAVDGVEQLTEQQAVIVTGYTGVLCCSFGAFHADLEKRAGRSVLTHEMDDFGWIKTLYRDDFIALACQQQGGPQE